MGLLPSQPDMTPEARKTWKSGTVYLGSSDVPRVAHGPSVEDTPQARARLHLATTAMESLQGNATEGALNASLVRALEVGALPTSAVSQLEPILEQLGYSLNS